MNPPKRGSAFQNALNLAFALHQGQVRKSADVPYFSHLMGVAAIVQTFLFVLGHSMLVATYPSCAQEQP